MDDRAVSTRSADRRRRRHDCGHKRRTASAEIVDQTISGTRVSSCLSRHAHGIRSAQRTWDRVRRMWPLEKGHSYRVWRVPHGYQLGRPGNDHARSQLLYQHTACLPYRVYAVSRMLDRRQAPTLKALYNQRKGWHRHLCECVTIHRRMLSAEAASLVGLRCHTSSSSSGSRR